MILEYATQHDLPVFITIDGSVSETGVATVSISIIAPDIRENDDEGAWQNRRAKILLIRSWRLPHQWGTGTTCINMAETCGLLLGEYTIPAEMPIIYITDSNNARTLQRNLKNSTAFTHREKIRAIKQGIDYSIASHLEHLTSKWPAVDQQTAHTKALYQRGEAVCKIWAEQSCSAEKACNDNDSIHSLTSWDDRSSSTASDLSNNKSTPLETKRYRFGRSMYDLLDRIIVVKVFSHQLNPDFSVKCHGNTPRPNLFVVSGNQIADNAAEQARRITSTFSDNVACVYYPPFSARWSFAFEGSLANKGATKVMQVKMDDELIMRQRLRVKQGLFHRLAHFIGTRPEQIGDESLLRNIVKLTAPCWTRCLYRYPPLANQTWKFWRSLQSSADQLNIPIEIPKNWKAIAHISDNIIRACPFCSTLGQEGSKRGNLEHFHLYCQKSHLRKPREHCNRKLEEALHNIYDFAAKQQYNCSLVMTHRTTALQEIMEVVARETELQERPVIRSTQLVNETRSSNKALLSSNEVNCAVLLHTLPSARANDYLNYPYASRLGLIHFLPEEEFDMATATITDVGFLGLFPKPILRELQRYARELKNLHQDVDAFNVLLDKLIHAFLYRPITMQNIIHILLAKVKDSLDLFDKQQASAALSQNDTTTTASTLATDINPTPKTLPPVQRQCCGSKCRVLQIQGIIPSPMLCTANRNLCSGCTNENQKHSTVARIEAELLVSTTNNSILAPILQHRAQPTSIRVFRKLLKCLPSFAAKSRNDHIYGAARYIANTIGVLIIATPNCNLLDPPMSTKQSNNAWRQARLLCKCSGATTATKAFGPRTFCTTCQYLLAHPSVSHVTTCPGCNINESWEAIGATCLACQLATITFRNPLAQRYRKFLEQWLPGSDDDDSIASTESVPAPARCPLSDSTPTQDELYSLRQASFNSSFAELKSRNPRGQSNYVFENLSLLQKSVTRNFTTNKNSDLRSLQSDTTLSCLTKENLPTAKGTTNRPTTNTGASIASQCSTITNTLRPPLSPLDINSTDFPVQQRKRLLSRSEKKQDRTLQKKRKKNETAIVDKPSAETLPALSSEPFQ